MIHQIEPSLEFKTQTRKAIFSIVLFTIVYSVLLLLALALTALCIYGGVILVITVPRFFTIALGVGLASLGILILIFLLKFIFKSNKIDRSHLVEITAKDEPELFDLIKDIVNEVGTQFPKKVYLSSEVNASVFYNSSFWSMFFPVRKNLHIGLGLVNSLTKEELKAVLSHEFGHFSQKTMKVGSFVYNVNHVIYNMLFDNDGYDEIIRKWSSFSNYIAIFVVIAVKILDGIKWILGKMYGVVNKSYMALSREMEFHADEIAAHVTGYLPLTTALLRFQLADNSMSNVLSFYEGKISDNQKSENIFREQHYVMHFLADDNQIPIKNNFPSVGIDELNRFNKSKLIIKDQWASHPSTEERIKRLEQTNIIKNNGLKEPANQFFQNIERTQKQITEQMFSQVVFESKPSSLPLTHFEKEYKNNFSQNSFPKLYNSYYDNKNPIKFDLSIPNEDSSLKDYSELFSDKKVNQVYSHIALQNDIETLNMVADKSFGIKTFDYDGKKYQRSDVPEVVNTLQKEMKNLQNTIIENDRNIFVFFKELETKKGKASKLKKLYSDFFELDDVFEAKFGLYSKMSEKLEFLNVVTPHEEIKSNFRHLTSLERELKIEIESFLQNPKYTDEVAGPIRENFENYLSKEWVYFGNQSYFEDNLAVLMQALSNFSFLLSKTYFLHKKELLDYQVGLLG
ncbi:MAG: M48 family metallopeptidase [Allomuricauda sp.]|jgi:Zn-dependent protease with chaperone function